MADCWIGYFIKNFFFMSELQDTSSFCNLNCGMYESHLITSTAGQKKNGGNKWNCEKNKNGIVKT